MNVRHLVALANVAPDGFVADAARAVHGTVRAGSVFAVGGEVDLATHCNLDFDDHRIDACLVAEALTPGSPIVTDPTGVPLVVRVKSNEFRPRGVVDVGARRIAWLQAVAAARTVRSAHLSIARTEDGTK
mgnify:FL=1